MCYLSVLFSCVSLKLSFLPLNKLSNPCPILSTTVLKGCFLDFFLTITSFAILHSSVAHNSIPHRAEYRASCIVGKYLAFAILFPALAILILTFVFSLIRVSKLVNFDAPPVITILLFSIPLLNQFNDNK